MKRLSTRTPSWRETRLWMQNIQRRGVNEDFLREDQSLPTLRSRRPLRIVGSPPVRGFVRDVPLAFPALHHSAREGCPGHCGHPGSHSSPVKCAFMLLTWFSVPLPVAEISVAHRSGDIMAQCVWRP